jgi:amino acid transporter
MSARRAAGIAVAAAGALQGGGADAGGAAGEAAGEGKAPKKKTSRGLLIGLGAIVVLVLVLLAFFVFWDFSGGAEEGAAPDQESVPAETTGETTGEPGVSDPSASGA